MSSIRTRIDSGPIKFYPGNGVLFDSSPKTHFMEMHVGTKIAQSSDIAAIHQEIIDISFLVIFMRGNQIDCVI